MHVTMKPVPMVSPLRLIIELSVLAIVLLVQVRLGRWVAEQRLLPARWARLAAAASASWIVAGFAFSLPPLAPLLPGWQWLAWLRGFGMAWALVTLGLFVAAAVWRNLPEFSPDRRRFLTAARTALLAAPAAVTGFGIFVERSRFHLRAVDLPVGGLPADLHGLRLVLLSDIHLSPFLSGAELDRVVAMANETRPHVAVVTGDLITTAGDPLAECLARLARLRSDAGVLGCLGNHEIYADAEDFADREGRRLGLRFLRGAAERLRFGKAVLNIAGVDYQRSGLPYLVGAERLVAPGAVNLLLSHNPDVFPVAARKGFAVTLAGHTHGGQVAVEILNRQITLARFLSPYVYGLYRRGPASIYVTRGIGTVGVPARIGAPPEVALIRLCAT